VALDSVFFRLDVFIPNSVCQGNVFAVTIPAPLPRFFVTNWHRYPSKGDGGATGHVQGGR
jgi:hypothetical protein